MGSVIYLSAGEPSSKGVQPSHLTNEYAQKGKTRGGLDQGGRDIRRKILERSGGYSHCRLRDIREDTAAGNTGIANVHLTGRGGMALS